MTTKQRKLALISMIESAITQVQGNVSALHSLSETPAQWISQSCARDTIRRSPLQDEQGTVLNRANFHGSG